MPNNMYKAQTCASLHYSTDKCTGRWCCESTPKAELPDPRKSLASDIPSCAIEQDNQEIRQDDHYSQHVSNQASNALSNFHLFKFHVYLISYT